jgi:uncharacterized protein with PQ loop repeat
MSQNVVIASVGWAAVASSFGSTLSQFRRARTSGVEGVSFATWALFVYVGCFWIAYGLAVESWVTIMGSLLILPMQGAILARLEPLRQRRAMASSFGVFFACCILPIAIWGWAGGVYGLGIVLVLVRSPQLFELIRHEDATGVSSASWYMSAGACALWVWYFAGADLVAALVASAVAGLASLAIALLTTWRHLKRTEVSS